MQTITYKLKNKVKTQISRVFLYTCIVPFFTLQSAPSLADVFAVGDVMVKANPTVFKPLEGISEIMQSLSKSSIGLFNAEGVLLRYPNSSQRCDTRVKNCHLFEMHPLTAQYLKSHGFQVANFANNHILDYSVKSVFHSTTYAKKQGLAVVGLNEEKLHRISHLGRTFSFIGASAHNGTFSTKTQLSDIYDLIRYEKSLGHIVIFTAHLGAEGVGKTDVPLSNEIYLGHDRGNTRKILQGAVDSGAASVFAHGPHVPRGVQIYNNTPIFYSLGNFLTTNGFNLDSYQSYGLIAQVFFDNNNNFKYANVYAVQQQKTPFSTIVVPSPPALEFFKNLTQKSFPNEITWDGGRFEIKK